MQEVFNVCKSINVTHHIDNLKDKHHMIISPDAEKAFNKIQYPFMKQTNKQKLQKIGIEGSYLILYNTATANIILNDEKLKAFSLRNKARMPL